MNIFLKSGNSGISYEIELFDAFECLKNFS